MELHRWGAKRMISNWGGGAQDRRDNSVTSNVRKGKPIDNSIIGRRLRKRRNSKATLKGILFLIKHNMTRYIYTATWT